MSVAFNDAMGLERKRAVFDARSFNIPPAEVANYFLWRALDWRRNSVAMYCGAFYSHREMHGKGHADQHEMLHAKGKNWSTDLSPRLRNGTFLVRKRAESESKCGGFAARDDVLPKWAEINSLVETFGGESGGAWSLWLSPGGNLNDLRARRVDDLRMDRTEAEKIVRLLNEHGS